MKNETQYYFTRQEALGQSLPTSPSTTNLVKNKQKILNDKQETMQAVDRLKQTRKLRNNQPNIEKPNQLLSELHRKSYFKTSAEIPLDFGCMKGVK